MVSKLAVESDAEKRLHELFSKLRDPGLSSGKLEEVLGGIKGLYYESSDKFFEAACAISNSSVRAFKEKYLMLFSRLEGFANSTGLADDYKEVKELLEGVKERMELQATSNRLFNSIFRTRKGLSLNEDELRRRIEAAVKSESPIEIIAFWKPQLDPATKNYSPNKDELLWLVTSLKESGFPFKLTILIQDINPAGEENGSLKNAVAEIERFARSCCDDRIRVVFASAQRLGPAEHVRADARMLSSIEEEITKTTRIPKEEVERLARAYIRQMQRIIEEVGMAHRNAVYVTTAPKEHAPLYSGLPISFIEARHPPTPKEMQENVWRLLNELRDITNRAKAADELVLLFEAYPDTFAQALRTMPPISEKHFEEVGTEAKKEREKIEGTTSISTAEKRREMFGPLLDMMPRLKRIFVLAEERIAQMTAEDVLQIFMQKQYYKDEPLYRERLIRIIADRVAKGEPLEFIFFWGAFKESESGLADTFDHAALKTLRTLLDEVSKIYSPAPDKDGKPRHNKIRIIFTDAFAENVNGKDREAIERYYESLMNMLKGFDLFGDVFKVERLSALYSNWVDEKDPRIWLKRMVEAAVQSSAMINSHPEIFSSFVRMARKHSDLVRRKQMSAANSAAIYLTVRTWESSNLSAGAQPMVISPGEAATERMFSRIPTVFVILDRRTAQVPWFADEKNPPPRTASESGPTERMPHEIDVLRSINLHASRARDEVRGPPGSQLSERAAAEIKAAACHVQFELTSLQRLLMRLSGKRIEMKDDDLQQLAHSAALLCVYGDSTARSFYNLLAERFRNSDKRRIAKKDALDEVDALCTEYAHRIASPFKWLKAKELAGLVGTKRQKADALVFEVLKGLSEEVKAAVASRYGNLPELEKEKLVEMLEQMAEDARKPLDAGKAMETAMRRNIIAELLVLNDVSPRKLFSHIA